MEGGRRRLEISFRPPRDCDGDQNRVEEGEGRFDWTWSQLRRRRDRGREEGSGFDRRIALSLSEEGAALKSRVGVARSPTPNRERDCGWMESWNGGNRTDEKTSMPIRAIAREI